MKLFSVEKKKKKNTIFIGNIEDENEVFKWILEQKADESIELIDREQLFEYIGSKDFLAVVFCKYPSLHIIHHKKSF